MASARALLVGQSVGMGASAAHNFVELEPHAAALVSLLQEPAVRLCPPASAAGADAALALLSALKAARLQVDEDGAVGSSELAAHLEGSMQRLLAALHQGLAPPTPAPCIAQASHDPEADSVPSEHPGSSRAVGGQRRQQMAQLVRGLGFSARDWQAAQAGLAQRTAAALQPLLPLPSPALHGGAAAIQQGSAVNSTALGDLLAAAVDTPMWQGHTGQPSALHGATQQLLCALRQFPPAGGAPAGAASWQQLELSAEGWAAYWMFEPLALQQTLAEILQAAAAQPAPALPSLQRQQAARSGSPQQEAQQQRHEQQQQQEQLLERMQLRPHWTATAAAAAAHPALHLAIRQTLHDWLAASGNSAVWRLLLLYLQAARCSSNSAGSMAQPGQQPLSLQQNPQQQQQRRQQECQEGGLPASLQVLYPPGLSRAAFLLRREDPSLAGLLQALAELQTFLQPPPPQQGQQLGQQGCPYGAEPLLLAPACQQRQQQKQRQVWQLQLDAPSWALFSLRCLPLRQLLRMASDECQAAGAAAAAAGKAGQGGNGVDGGGEAAGRLGGEEEPPTAAAAAAEYVALLMWPLQPRRQQVLAEALQLRLEDVCLPAVCPWLEQLVEWEQMLAGMLAG